MTIREGDFLWTPNRERIEESNIVHYMSWLKAQDIVEYESYQELREWSINNTQDYWSSLWMYFNIISETPYHTILGEAEIGPSNNWFLGARVNLAEHILRHEREDCAALLALSETRSLSEISWADLAKNVRVLGTRMRAMGIAPGDPVACLMPTIPETVIAMLATFSIGAVWSSAAPEFGRQTILDRFLQLQPKWLFVADGYQFGGKTFDRRSEISAISDALSPSLEVVAYLPYLGLTAPETPVSLYDWGALFEGRDPGKESFRFERVPDDHPLWVVYSSGTTGRPKAIVHNHVGVLINFLSLNAFNYGIKEGDVSFFYTTTGWIVFNSLVGMMLNGSSIVLYDGSPIYPGADVLWRMAADAKANLFGVSPAYVQVLGENQIKPSQKYDLSNLSTIMLSGSPATPEIYKWFYDNVKEDLWVGSVSGGTEVAGCFVGASEILPVRAGEIQCRLLGFDIEAWNEKGEPVTSSVGELVCKQPFPSMPLYFLGDDDRARYQASYFDKYPGVWRHGDFVKINEDGGVYIYGRSDATLNRHGVRIGTAELYNVVESFSEVTDSLVVCIERSGGTFFMPMFLQIAQGCELDQSLKMALTQALRSQCSPRHVPDQFYCIAEVPYTLTGKKMEVPVRNLLMGWSLQNAVDKETMRNPAAMEYFVDFARQISKSD